ncbi:MAG: exodeoxyribonuclease VII small subunit [Methylotenera sp.]|nr:MAG: exodeoxyribonuclease VII small subunit [Methylotenera sp.]
MTASTKISTQKNQADTVNNGVSFEQAVIELEAIVQQMELGNLALDASFNAYKRGAELLQICQASLSNVEQQVRILTDANKLAAFSVDNA